MRQRSLRIIFAANMFVMCYLFYMNGSSIGPAMLHKTKQLGDSVFNALRGSSSMRKASNPCAKRIVLFGIRQHWLQFGKENPNYRHLVQFPRKFSCQNVGCSVFLDYTVLPRDIRDYDIVIFTNVYLWMTSDMWDWVQGNRSAGQRWAMISLESPLNSVGIQPPKKYADVTFDWLGSYKSDSDLYMPYGYYEAFSKIFPPKVTDLSKYLTNKSKLIAWVGSNCDTVRMKIVEELKQFVHIDTYGKCGETQLPWDDNEAVENTLKKYHFYLSLENSCCNEYITEKFWRTLDLGVVPVVMGPSVKDYLNVMPRQSFIHVNEFSTMKELAKYLIHLQLNTEEYLEYFRWRNSGKVVAISQEEQYVRPLTDATYCDVVHKYLHTDSTHQRKLEYFGSQWHGSCSNCSVNLEG
ncbi:Alpha-(1,3)-fucosyltransferase 4 [Holothuria leucospilota]|uniref:Fucosyltransferase n=1 Tax=Holothuria leucospilota TaxID=206669 RepID=A0A9Q1B9H4_HOLLE|nr:Alpha-(1,3)-fucosyltransferase 4 [Holothuria leucospilota]